MLSLNATTTTTLINMAKSKRRGACDTRKRNRPQDSTRRNTPQSKTNKPICHSDWARLAPHVQHLPTHSHPSPDLPPRLARIFCAAPVRSSPFHPDRAPLLQWATVRRIPPGTRCSEPALLAKERSKRLAAAAKAPVPPEPSTSKAEENLACLHPAAGQ